MGVEIERKFLLKASDWGAAARSVASRQGYLAFGPPVSVRVRIMGDEARLNIKESTLAMTRREFEYAIPLSDAEDLLAGHCVGRLVEKTRHYVDYAGRRWEVDEFAGANQGLVVVEIELESEDATLELPPWVGEEVTGDARYLNTSLAQNPYSTWG